MLQHPNSEFYDLSSANGINSRQTPPHSPTRVIPTMINSNNNNSNSNSNNNNNNNASNNTNSGNNNNNNSNNNNNNNTHSLDLHAEANGNNGGSAGSGAAAGREALVSFGFTQEQVACVCEVSFIHKQYYQTIHIIPAKMCKCSDNSKSI